MPKSRETGFLRAVSVSGIASEVGKDTDIMDSAGAMIMKRNTEQWIGEYDFSDSVQLKQMFKETFEHE